MNPYEISELENKDLYCEDCESVISTQTYLDNQGICNKCLEKEYKTMNYFEILSTENRIALLRGRTKENGKIVKKLERKLRRLKSEQ